MLKRKEHKLLFNSSLAALGYIYPQINDELQKSKEFHKDYVQRIKDSHIDVDNMKIGEIREVFLNLED